MCDYSHFAVALTNNKTPWIYSLLSFVLSFFQSLFYFFFRVLFHLFLLSPLFPYRNATLNRHWQTGTFSVYLLIPLPSLYISPAFFRFSCSAYVPVHPPPPYLLPILPFLLYPFPSLFPHYFRLKFVNLHI